MDVAILRWQTRIKLGWNKPHLSETKNVHFLECQEIIVLDAIFHVASSIIVLLLVRTGTLWQTDTQKKNGWNKTSSFRDKKRAFPGVSRTWNHCFGCHFSMYRKKNIQKKTKKCSHCFGYYLVFFFTAPLQENTPGIPRTLQQSLEHALLVLLVVVGPGRNLEIPRRNS